MELGRFLTISILVGLSAACSRNDEQAIRHLVMADLIQNEHLPESHIAVESVQVSGTNADVTARVLGGGGRSDAWRTIQYRLRRNYGRWAVAEHPR